MANADMYKVITDKVVKRIEESIKNKTPFRWVKPWNGYPTGNFIEYTRNPEKFKAYRGINRILLDGGLYITKNQLDKLEEKDKKKYKIKKGCHRETVYFYKKCEYVEKDDKGKPVLDDDGNEVKKTFFLMRYYGVFNIQDIEGLDEFKIEGLDNEYDETALSKKADKIAKEYCKRHGVKLQVKKGIDSAYYTPALHTVTVPAKSQFNSLEEYYSTLFHELTHSTSKPLKRELGTAFGSEKYSFEELVAELGSLFLMQTIGFDTSKTENNSTAYLKGWLKKFKEDSSFIVKASTKAQLAVDCILDEKFEIVEDDDKAA